MLEIWQLYPRDRGVHYGDKLLSGEALLQGERSSAILASIKQLRLLSQHAAEKTKSQGRGRPKEEWLREFIRIVAHAYKSSGGAVSAAWQDGQGRRSSRFLRVLHDIHVHVPDDKRASSEKALDELARKVIREEFGSRKGQKYSKNPQF